MQKSFDVIKFIAKMFNSCPTSVHSQAHSGNYAFVPKKCMRRTLTQRKLLIPCEYRSTG